ncbi:damage-inducible protein [Bordetella trematum]|uniref:CinA-like protein n=1 Tax=Bordetella trematum TaxID=123899 RepID=A0A157RA17_9BORD|nr:molybdopterin-binding protein [Bordetella trematum]AUL48175.1 competence/damage-inducible protein A [Bordetella trematum]AZR95143.1 damage-inducible protein [Bordetella trematum]NNH18694.1 competence/damage-inducible protein A [Bordetella trematum]QIM70085.1 competence/damage-inducible protein A [Bordetella trematum]SAH89409.1 CinA-like protein [Bordetella trematum]
MVTDTASRRIGLIIVGDEILSGRRQDKHFAKVVEMLSMRGMKLSWAQVLPDDREVLADAYRRSFASGDIVFSCGGIGATPDDHTRQAAAAALGLSLALHPLAEEAIVQRTRDLVAKGQGSLDMSTPENQQRLQMGMFPSGCEIIPNPYNRIPGFYLRDHSFVPGFPVMAWPMLEWTLDTRYRELQHTVVHTEHSFLVFGLPESRITLSLQTLESRWPGVKAFSLPSVGEAGAAPHIELGVKGDPDAAAQALEFLRAEVERLGGSFVPPAR